MARNVPSTAVTWVVVGRATTHGQVLPLGSDDPVVAARAVRRALADGHRRAADVGALAVATPPPLSLDAVARFARRALGPHGTDVTPAAVEAAEPDAEALLGSAIRSLPSDHRRPGIAVVVAIAADGTAIALCLSAGGRER
jgi:hypothetical protein